LAKDSILSLGLYDPSAANMYINFLSRESMASSPMLEVLSNDIPTVGKARLKGEMAPFIRIQPNPFNPVTQIILNTGGQAASVHVFDLSGKKIASFQYRDKPITWNAAGYASGIYIVKAEIGQLKLLKKAVILK